MIVRSPSPLSRTTRSFPSILPFLHNPLVPSSRNASICSKPQNAHNLFDEKPQRDHLRLHLHHACKAKTPRLVGSLHCLSFKTGQLSHPPTCTSLLTAYADVGMVQSSLALFGEAAYRDVVSWNAALRVLVQDGDFEGAFTLFQRIPREFGEFDSVTFVTLLKAASSAGCWEVGVALHASIIARGLEMDRVVSNSLMDMYAKLGNLQASESIFKQLEWKDVISWNSMITGFHHNGFSAKSALCFQNAIHSGFVVDYISFSGVLSACTCLEELHGFAKTVHAFATKLGCVADVSIMNSLLSFYSQRGDVEAVETVYSEMDARNVVSCNGMLKLYAENDREIEAFNLLHVMQYELRIDPNSATLITVIPLCAKLNLLREARALHGFAMRKGIEYSNVSIANSLLDMYAKCGQLGAADNLFHTMVKRDLISWNTIIFAHSRSGSMSKVAKTLFRELLYLGLGCSLATVLAILPSCGPNDHQFGKLIHSWMCKCGFSSCIPAINALMLTYINTGDPLTSFRLLDSIGSRSNLISWNTVIVGCTRNGYFESALQIFNQMRKSSNLGPDLITLVSVISAHGNLSMLHEGSAIHGLAVKTLVEMDLRVTNALISMYSRCGDVKSAELVFGMDGERNLCSWNCIISGLVQNSKSEKALQYFRHMGNFPPNEFTIVCLLCASTQLNDLQHGKEINGYAYRFGFQENAFISAALVDMFSKCGRLDAAIQVFRRSPEKSIASWNSMIFAYGYHGYGREAIRLFSEMCKYGIKPTKSTLIGILSACSHSGLIHEGLEYYMKMSSKFGINPMTEHHVCVVDMLGRAGRLNEAYEFMQNITEKPSPSVLGALLNAFKCCGDVERGKFVAERLFLLDPKNKGYYLALCDLYSVNERWSDAVDVRNKIEEKGLLKPPGSSLIQGCSV